jgi:hypothetical protein
MRTAAALLALALAGCPGRLPFLELPDELPADEGGREPLEDHGWVRTFHASVLSPLAMRGDRLFFAAHTLERGAEALEGEALEGVLHIQAVGQDGSLLWRRPVRTVGSSPTFREAFCDPIVAGERIWFGFSRIHVGDDEDIVLDLDELGPLTLHRGQGLLLAVDEDGTFVGSAVLESDGYGCSMAAWPDGSFVTMARERVGSYGRARVTVRAADGSVSATVVLPMLLSSSMGPDRLAALPGGRIGVTLLHSLPSRLEVGGEQRDLPGADSFDSLVLVIDEEGRVPWARLVQLPRDGPLHFGHTLNSAAAVGDTLLACGALKNGSIIDVATGRVLAIEGLPRAAPAAISFGPRGELLEIVRFDDVYGVLSNCQRDPRGGRWSMIHRFDQPTQQLASLDHPAARVPVLFSPAGVFGLGAQLSDEAIYVATSLAPMDPVEPGYFARTPATDGILMRLDRGALLPLLPGPRHRPGR